ncbi:MAG: inner membrane protein YpjD [Rubrivivax sp.]
MILSTDVPSGWPLLLAVLAVAAYAVSLLGGNARLDRVAMPAFVVGVAAHAAMLLSEIGSLGFHGGAARLGFGPVLSLTVCMALAIHALDGRFMTVVAVRRLLACAGAAGVVVECLFPGEARVLGSSWAPLHWLLGVASYGLLGAAVLHGLLLDAAERRLRRHKGLASMVSGVPLLQIERITFRFVEAGFAVLSAAIALGILTSAQWRWDHKTVLSLVSWGIFALLLLGRHGRGWRGRQATRWLYAGALVLLLAYVGSRFVLEVLLSRSVA